MGIDVNIANYVPSGWHRACHRMAYHLHDGLKKIGVHSLFGEEDDSINTVLFHKFRSNEQRVFHKNKNRVLGWVNYDWRPSRCPDTIPDSMLRYLNAYDFLVATTPILQQYWASHIKHAYYFPEPIDIDHYNGVLKIHQEKKEYVLVCTGVRGKIQTINGPCGKALERLVKDGIKLKFRMVTDHINDPLNKIDLQIPYELIEWDDPSFANDMIEGDIAILPDTENDTSMFYLKSANRARTCMTLGIPVVAQKNYPDVIETITYGENGYYAQTEEEWYDCIKSLLLDIDLRKEISTKGVQLIEKEYSVIPAAKRMLSIVDKVLNPSS